MDNKLKEISPKEMLKSLQQTYAEDMASKAALVSELRVRYTEALKRIEELTKKDGKD